MFGDVIERLALRVAPNQPPSAGEPSLVNEGGESADSSRRRYRRWSVNLNADVVIAGTRRHCAVYDISPGGARIELAAGAAVALGARAVMEIAGFAPIPAEVRYSNGDFLGLRFSFEQQEEVEFARFLVALRPPRRRERRAVSNSATIRFSGTELPCVVSNISRTGAAVSLDETRHFDLGGEAVLTLPGHRPLAALVRHIDGNTVGLRLIDVYDGD